jgi:EAL domain-containing protein (putative c-di-GMP-specific phosphodiesterase class I)
MSLTMTFQPIVRITPDGVVPFAYEALVRLSGSESPAVMFREAERRGQLAELNVLLVTRAIAAAATLPESADIFINVDPVAFGAACLVPRFVDAVERANISFDRIVLEVTEHSSLDENDAQFIGASFERLRAYGVRFALDDLGSGHSHLSWLDRIRPSFVKIGNDFGTGFECDSTKKNAVQETFALARTLGCELILEGVETDETAAAARSLGVPCAQGFWFGRPQEANHWTETTPALRAA